MTQESTLGLMKLHCSPNNYSKSLFPACADRSAPRNVRLTAVNSSTVVLTWEDPFELIGYFGGYFVHWRCDNGSRNSSKAQAPTSHIFTGLQPGQNITASVSVRTKGHHHYSNEVSVTTPSLKEGEFYLLHS